METGAINPLASKEAMLRDRFERFLDRVYHLQAQLEQGEPDNAARLGRVLQRAGELGLAEQLEEIVRLLRDSPSMTEALDAQTNWLADADHLLDVLLERDSENQERRDQIERTEAYKRQLSEILEQQQGLRDAAAKAGLEARMNVQLDQAIERLNSLLEKQEGLAAKTGEQARAAAPQPAEGLSAAQKDLERAARQLAEELEKLGALQPDSSVDSPELESARQSAQEAGQSTKNAAGAMSEAGEKLEKGEPGPAAGAQEQARESLREAKARLEEAKAALNDDPDNSIDADEQKRLADRTGQLSEQMKQDAGAAGGSKGEPKPGSPSGSSSEARKGLQRAKGEMDNAARKLEQDQSDEAVPSQNRAIAELEQVKSELEKMLEQLRREDRAEMLADLEERFREMLSKQRSINASTIRLSGLGLESFQRSEQLELADLAAAENALAEKAATCGHILEEEGTTVAFPRIVGQLAQDMKTLADRLSALLVGPLSQAIGTDIVETLEQLLDAVKKMQQENEQQSASGENNKEDQPLLPTSAELKLLRSSQVRVNKRTAAIEEAREDESEPQTVLARLLETTTNRQAQCAEIASEMRDRKNMP